MNVKSAFPGKDCGSPTDSLHASGQSEGIKYYTEEDVHMPPGLSLSLEKALQDERIKEHSHCFIEVGFVARGSAVHRHVSRGGNVRSSCLIQGDVFSVLPGEKHGFEHCCDMVLYNIFLTADFLLRYAELEELPGWKYLFGERTGIPNTIMHLPAALHRRASEYLDRAAAERKSQRVGFAPMMTAEVLEFLIYAMRAFAMIRETFSEENNQILQSVAMMEAKPEKKFTLGMLANAAHVSVPSYTKKFREAIGSSPMEYLQKLRLLQARYYLSYSDLPIGEIAVLSGFCTSNYFIKIFKRELGKTPLQYRSAYKKLPDK